ncbi:MAG: YkvA family protein [Acidimicrobiia bacterium]|nr:YkvA family protein [Acidimicrobiia bacterium]
MDDEIVEITESRELDPVLAKVDHPLDTAPPVPMRSRQEVIAEALLLLPNLGKLLFRLLRDPRVPRNRRWVMAAVGAYLASPIDLIPDFVPVLGTVDDLLVMAFGIDYLLKASPPEVVIEHWDGSEDGLELVRGLTAWGVELLPSRIQRLFAQR